MIFLHLANERGRKVQVYRPQSQQLGFQTARIS
jgi:hypothetical protein